MLVYFTDAVTEKDIAINPTYVTAVFVAPDGEMEGKTVIGLINGTIVVSESQLDVVGKLQAELK